MEETSPSSGRGRSQAGTHGGCRQRLLLLSPALQGAVGQPQPPRSTGQCWGRGTLLRAQRPPQLLSPSYCTSGQAPGWCSHDMTSLDKLRQLCPQAKNFYQILTRTVSDSICGPGAGTHHSKDVPCNTSRAFSPFRHFTSQLLFTQTPPS